MATREIVKTRLQQQLHHRQEAQPVIINNDRSSYTAVGAIPYWSVPRRQSHHQYEDQQLIESSVEEETNYSNDGPNDQGGASRDHYDDSNDFDLRQVLDNHRGDDSNDQGDDSNDQNDDSNDSDERQELDYRRDIGFNDQGDDSNDQVGDSNDRHQVHVNQRAGGPPKIISRFWFEDANGKFVGGNKKCQIKPVELKAPQVKRVRFSLDNEDANAPGPSTSSGINSKVEVSSFGNNSSQKQAQLPTATPSDGNNQEVYRSIKQIEMIEYGRRRQMVKDLVRICKDIPLTVKMMNPLIHFNGWPN